jgi:hypothetical protein
MLPVPFPPLPINDIDANFFIMQSKAAITKSDNP